jgi:PRC-barrel domain
VAIADACKALLGYPSEETPMPREITAFIVSVGGFLGVGEKHVAVPFDNVHATERKGERWLAMNTTKDALKTAAGYKYDRAKATWVPA